MPSIGLSSNGTGNIPSFNAVNNSDTVQVATVSITATDNGCSSSAGYIQHHCKAFAGCGIE